MFSLCLSFSIVFLRVMLCCVVWESACGVCGVVCSVALLVCVWCVPRRVLTYPTEVRQRNRRFLPISSFENKSNTACSRFLQSFALPDENCSTPASMKKTYKKNQPLDGSICLSPQETECNERFARQYRYEPPQENSPALLTLRSPSFGSSHLCPNSNHFQDQRKYTYVFS